jgi:hypothetical protein
MLENLENLVIGTPLRALIEAKTHLAFSGKASAINALRT